MTWPTLQCLLWGHDDRLTSEPGHIFLQCADCGRRSAGWDLHAEAVAVKRPADVYGFSRDDRAPRSLSASDPIRSGARSPYAAESSASPAPA